MPLRADQDGRAVEEKRGVGVRRCVLTFFFLSLLTPTLLQVGYAVQRAWWPWLVEYVCSTDQRKHQTPDRSDAGWVPVRTTLRVRRN
jgi:hypothetical protein